MVYRFIDDNKQEFGVRWLCRKFKIYPSSYYNYIHHKSNYYKEKKEIFELIKYIYYNNNRAVGYRQMKYYLERYGYKLSLSTVHKYMNKYLGLCAIIMRKKPRYFKGYQHKLFDNVIKQSFCADAKNRVWCIDFTYMREPSGKFRYNCSVIDLYDRYIVGSLNDSNMNTTLAINTINIALEKENHPKGIILHSDQGVQFTSLEFSEYCKEKEIIQSMSKAGCPYDNAPMERFFNTFKNTFYNIRKFDCVREMDLETYKFINWYNYVRPHSANNYMTPHQKRYS